jgi:hypothetical protein
MFTPSRRAAPGRQAREGFQEAGAVGQVGQASTYARRTMRSSRLAIPSRIWAKLPASWPISSCAGPAALAVVALGDAVGGGRQRSAAGRCAAPA